MRDGDPIHGVIAASGVNQDGASNGITAPNGDSQERLILRTYEKFSIDPDQISYVETHGTGTPLGDPVEANALVRAFKHHTDRTGYCTIGSAKAHIGHAAASAGVIGLIKVLLSLKHEEIPALLNFKRLNPHIQFEGSPFVIPTKNRPWPKGHELRFAALNSFGHSGTNVHLVIREHHQESTPATNSGDEKPYLFPLSATNTERLSQYARKLGDFLEDANVALRDLAYSLQIGRTRLKHSVCFAASDIATLRAQLMAFADGSSVSDVKDALPRDWNELYADPAPRRINIPTYPFAKTRFWMAEKETVPEVDILHPLIQLDAKTPEGPGYKARFTGNESFLRDHVIKGRPTLPGVAYLEMACAAYGMSSSDGDVPTRLSGIAWTHPVTTDVGEITIQLRREASEPIRFEVLSAIGTHCQGTVSRATSDPVAVQDVLALRERMAVRRLDGAECYELLEAMGIHYGPSHQGIDSLYLGHGEGLAQLRKFPDDEMSLPPGLLDSALQATLGLSGDGVEGAYIPYALDSLDIHAPCQKACWAWVRSTDRESGPSLRKYDIDLLDDSGLLCLRFNGMAFRPVKTQTDAALIWHKVWQESPLQSPDQDPDVQLHTVTIADAVNEDPASWFGRAIKDLVRTTKSITQDNDRNHLLRVVVPASHSASMLPGLSGFLKTASLEYSRLSTQLIELDGPADFEAENASHVRYVGGKRLTPFWQESNITAAPVPWRDNGIYLITGGLGGIGLIMAREIAQQTAKATIVLSGRSTISDNAERTLEKIRTLGAKVVYRQSDVSDADAVEVLVKSIVSDFGALNGVLHTAGILRDGYIHSKSEADMDAVLTPKISGTLNLDRATKTLDLDAFILFAAAAGSFGNPGQADYAAANGFMDVFATWRNVQTDRTGLTCAIDWPLWDEGGMPVGQATAKAIETASGARPLSSSAAIEALYRALASNADQILVLAGDQARLRNWVAAMNATPPIKGEMTLPDATSLKQTVRQFLIECSAKTLELDILDIDPRDELSEYGFDSITFTELTNHVNIKFGLEFAPTLFFEYPTIDKVTAYLLKDAALAVREAFDAQPALPAQNKAAPRATAEPAKQKHRGVAIIGMSGRFPGALDIDGFWDVLAEGRDCIAEIPPDRWDWQSYWGDAAAEPGKTKVKRAGFIEGIGEFDSLFFGISPREAELMDPQQRLLMTHAWSSIEDAGYAPSSLAGSNTAIFVGTAPSGYAKRIGEARISLGGHSSTGSTASIGPNRVSYLLDLHGPSEPVETACSSALVAIHRAIEGIRGGRYETALAGGVNCIVLPEVHASFDAAGMLSPDGTCKTFSRAANGYGRGEGAAMVFLKDLDAAERDGDPIHAVIIGSAENHGGRASSLTAPNPKAQAALLKDAVRDAGIDPTTIGYIETHGTGTELGDPIEIQGIIEAYQELCDESGLTFSDEARCGLGSVKSNIGHLELAAGVAGLIKVVLQMRHKTLAPSLHATEQNPFIKLDGTPFHIVRESQPWPASKDDNGQELPRRAGLSSFGFGGVNAHLVVEEYLNPESTREPLDAPVLIILSAKDKHRLMDVVRNLLLATAGKDRPNLHDLAYTLQVGRDAFQERLAFEAGSYEALHDVLKGILAEYDVPGVYRGRAHFNSAAANMFDDETEKAQTVREWWQNNEMAKLLSLWVNGLDIDWNKVDGRGILNRVRLPVYPFARESFWIEPQQQNQLNESTVALSAGTEDLHATLLDRVVRGDCSAEDAIRLVRERQG
jgi:polyketide synthase PksN